MNRSEILNSIRDDLGLSSPLLDHLSTPSLRVLLERWTRLRDEGELVVNKEGGPSSKEESK